MKSNDLIIGGAGSGKTHSIRTLAALPQISRVAILSHEPGMEHVIFKDADQPGGADFGPHPWRSKIAHCYIPPARTTWASLKSSFTLINTLSAAQLQDLKNASKSDYQQLLQCIEAMANFPDRITGEKLGAIDSWDDTWAFVDDGLSGLSQMAMDLTIGAKPIATQPEWGVAMGAVERLVDMMLYSTRCSVVILAHLAREKNEVTGGTEVTALTLGQKLAPKLPPKFDEVIISKRNGTKFIWSTADVNVDLKSRRLPIADNLEPDFRLIFNGGGK